MKREAAILPPATALAPEAVPAASGAPFIDPTEYSTVCLFRDAQDVLDRARRGEALNYRDIHQARQLLDAAMKYEGK